LAAGEAAAGGYGPSYTQTKSNSFRLCARRALGRNPANSDPITEHTTGKKR
jgi:hypothetical protein